MRFGVRHRTRDKIGMVSTAAGQNGDGTGRTRKVGTVLNKCIKYIIRAHMHVTQIYDLVACVRLAYRGTGIRK